MKQSIVPRLLISLIGLSFIIWGISTVMLWYAGESTDAVITSIRRQGGERNDSIPGRYTYSIGYTFVLPDGRKVDGTTTKIGGAIYMKADGSTKLPIRYFKALPFVNAPVKDTKPSFGQVVLIAAGILLLLVMNKKHRAH